MMFCHKHNIWYQGAKCYMCLEGDPPYLYTREEVADPNEWRRFVNNRWVK